MSHLGAKAELPGSRLGFSGLAVSDLGYAWEGRRLLDPESVSKLRSYATCHMSDPAHTRQEGHYGTLAALSIPFQESWRAFKPDAV